MMAGSYDDVPGPRLAYDRDGSSVVVLDSSGVYVEDGAQEDVEKVNDESTDAWTLGIVGWIAILFPDTVELRGWFLVNRDDGEQRTPQYSKDTTNGEDGTWEDVDNWTKREDVVAPDYRTGIDEPASPITGVTGFRWGCTDEGFSKADDFRAIHLYGIYESASDLEIWDPSADEVADGALFDFGDAPREGSFQQAFRVRNNHETETAEGVTLSVDTLTSGYEDAEAWFEFSDDDGSSWSATLDIGDLGPESESGEILVRMQVPSDADLGLTAMRIEAEATSWA